MRCRHDERVSGILYIYIDLFARPWLFSRLFFCRIPAVWRKVRVGLLTEVGLAPQARPGEQPGRLRRVAQVSRCAGLRQPYKPASFFPPPDSNALPRISEMFSSPCTCSQQVLFSKIYESQTLGDFWSDEILLSGLAALVRP